MLKFSRELKTITDLECSYDNYCDSIINDSKIVIIFNTKSPNIYSKLHKIKKKVINRNINNKQLLNQDYHVIMGEILGYPYCDSPANIRILKNYYC